ERQITKCGETGGGRNLACPKLVRFATDCKRPAMPPETGCWPRAARRSTPELRRRMTHSYTLTKFIAGQLATSNLQPRLRKLLRLRAEMSEGAPGPDKPASP